MPDAHSIREVICIGTGVGTAVMDDTAQLFFFRHAPVISAAKAGDIDPVYKGLGVAVGGAVRVIIAIADGAVVVGVAV